MAKQIIATLSIVFVLFLAGLGVRPEPPTTGYELGRWAIDRLRINLAHVPNLVLYVGYPLAEPEVWLQATPLPDDRAQLPSGRVIELDDINAYVLAYTNGDFLDGVAREMPMPAGVYAVDQSVDAEPIELDTDLLLEGQRFLVIEHTECPSRPYDHRFFTTTLTNTSDRPVRVLGITQYERLGDRWLSRHRFTAEQFRVWYGVSDSGWIYPGESVADPHNYGGLPGKALWAYTFETRAGATFTAGAARPRPSGE
ncbi:hypothetical protein [Mucisphaera sp.]|uniref:hypothetical protein n=1 Tax=Mucisphaera sp. TaxID=2913024 RepID=UPI003D0C684B